MFLRCKSLDHCYQVAGPVTLRNCQVVAAHFPQPRNNPVGVDFVVRARFFIARESVKTALMAEFGHGVLYAAEGELLSSRALKPQPERLTYFPAGVTTQMLSAVWM